MKNANVYLDKRRITENGYPVKIVIGRNTDRVMLSTGLYSTEDLVGGDFPASDPLRAQKNAQLTKMRSQIYEVLLEIGDRDISPKALKALIKARLTGKRVNRLVDYFDEFTSTQTNEGTITIYEKTRKKIAAFDDGVTLDEANVAWLLRLRKHMIDQGYSANYIGQHERNIRAVFNYCIASEYTEKYPFKKFKPMKERTEKRNLTVEQVRMLMEFPCEEYQKRYRDIFILQIYMAGIDIVDLAHLPNKPDLKAGDVLEYKRIKVGKKDAGYGKVRIEPEALEIINRYRGEKYLVNIKETYKDYVNFNHDMGKALKKIGPVVKGKRGKILKREPLFPNLSSKWSRHTWSSIAASKKVGIDTIERALAHTDERVGDIYINWYDELSYEANRTVIDAITAPSQPSPEREEGQLTAAGGGGRGESCGTTAGH